MILPETELESARVIAERMSEALFRPDGIDVTVSIGIGALDPAESTAKRIFRDADVALYRAKASGRARVASCLDLHIPHRDDLAPETSASPVQRADTKRLEQTVRSANNATAEALAILDSLESSTSVGLGFIDAEFRILRLNSMLAAMNGSNVEDQLGKKPAEVVPHLCPTLEPAYRQVMTTGKALTGLEISGKAVNGAPAYHLSGFYPVTANGERLGVCVVAIDITDRKRIEDGQLSLTRSAVNALASSVETCDQYTFGHQERVATIAVAIANLLGLVKAEVDTIWLAARIHDVGKLAIPAEILSRPGRLKPAEMELVRQHAQESANMLERVDFPEEVRELVLQHHERLDGSGYPRGLRGDEILMGARIITVSDVVEAMASHRPYWPAPGIELALKELRRGSGSLYDPDVVNACLRAFREGLVSLDHDV